MNSTSHQTIKNIAEMLVHAMAIISLGDIGFNRFASLHIFVALQHFQVF